MSDEHRSGASPRFWTASFAADRGAMSANYRQLRSISGHDGALHNEVTRYYVDEIHVSGLN